MNEKFHELNRGMAVQVVAQKIADGTLVPISSFEELVAEFQDEVLKLAEAFGTGDDTTATPKRAPRKAAEPKAESGKRAGPNAEELAHFIGKSQEGAATLQQIAEHFKVSKGVAKRAVKALPNVRSGTGTKPDGQRGKAPTIFWAE